MWARCSVLRVGSRAMRCGGAACVLLMLASEVARGAMLSEPLGADGVTPLPCPPCPPHSANCKPPDLINGGHECWYKINNNKGLGIKIDLKKKFHLICPDDGGTTLNDSSLPRFSEPTNFLVVILENCPLPAEPYAHALARLNVSVEESLSLKYLPEGELRTDHFWELETLSKLIIEPESNYYIYVSEPNVVLFSQLTNLMELNLQRVRLPPDLTALKGLEHLMTLILINCDLNETQFKQICGLPVLHKLDIIDHKLETQTELKCNFTVVTLIGSRLKSFPSFPSATALIMQRPVIQKIYKCGFLGSLLITNNNKSVTSLPDGWLAACAQLRRLELKTAYLRGTLTARALPANHSLEELSITGTKLEALSDDLFNYNKKLRVLKLANNRLKYLPLTVFSLLSDTLVSLDISRNMLDSTAVTSLNALNNLQELHLEYNKLGDLCDPKLFSSRAKLHLENLVTLSLKNTGATCICKDWHQLASLKTLYLENNHIPTLQTQDLKAWKQDTEIRLLNNNLSFIHISRDELKNNMLAYSAKAYFNTGGNKFRCDCRIYEFAQAYKQDWFPVHFDTLYCEGNEGKMLLDNMSLEEMVCDELKECPVNCTCLWRPSNNSAEIDCSSQGLTEFPDLGAINNWTWIPTKGEVVVRVRNNSIRVLPETLPARVVVLDARNNELRAADERTARALFGNPKLHLLLAGNPLDCNCSHTALTLAVFSSQIKELAFTYCSDGRPLLEAAKAGCSSRAVAAGGLGGVGGVGVSMAVLGTGVGALLLAGAVALALRRSTRLRLKAFLLARGLCLRWARPDDDDQCKYDAFLSYAHEDEAVALELLSTLEGGAGGAGGAPLRLCVHHRDWQPGEWILGQIAKSVRESRRTIILLSENFAKSSWARAEFREAYAHALREDAARLIVVVLGAAPPTDLEDDIRHYVQHNTYVRWGEPAFWEKLRVALPPGRPHASRERQRTSSLPKQRPAKEPQASKAEAAQPKSTRPEAANPMPADPQPAPPTRRPPPLRTDPPEHSLPPRPPTPVVKFGQIDFSAPLKPANTAAPPCA